MVGKKQSDQVSDSTRTRSPNYPFINLEKAVERAKVFYQRNGRHAAASETIAGFWGYGSKSSGHKLTMAALRSFGILEGGNDSAKLSHLGLDIVADYKENSSEWVNAIKDAARRPKIHAELWAKYGATLPSDEVLRRFLVREKEFNDKTVDDFIDEYKSTLAFAKMTDADMMPPADNVPQEDEIMAAQTIPASAMAATNSPPPRKPLERGDGPYISFPMSPTNTVEIRMGEMLSPSDFARFKKLIDLFEDSLVIKPEQK